MKKILRKEEEGSGTKDEGRGTREEGGTERQVKTKEGGRKNSEKGKEGRFRKESSCSFDASKDFKDESHFPRYS